MDLSETLLQALRARLEAEGIDLAINACCPHVAGVSIVFVTHGEVGHALVGHPIRGQTDPATLERWLDDAVPKLIAEAKKLKKAT